MSYLAHHRSTPSETHARLQRCCLYAKYIPHVTGLDGNDLAGKKEAFFLLEKLTGAVVSGGAQVL